MELFPLKRNKCLLFCLGAQKAGTTWLYRYLADRGDLFAKTLKEYHYFSDTNVDDPVRTLHTQFERSRFVSPGLSKDLLKLAAQLLRFNPDAFYRLCLRYGASDMPYYADFTPNYSSLGQEQSERLTRFSANSKYLFLMRDPVERMWSAMNFYWNKKDEPWMQTVAKRFDFDLTARERAFCQFAQGSDVQERSRYDETLSLFEPLIGPGQLLTIFYEELFTEDTIRKVCSFLNAPYAPAEFEFPHNTTHDKLDMSDGFRLWAASQFEETYEAMEMRFGVSRMPEWKRNMNLVDPKLKGASPQEFI